MAEALCPRELRLPGPLGRRPRLAIAVSGGADSMALALLARDWARARGGSVIGLIVDHGLRAHSAAEAVLVRQRLRQVGVPAEILTLRGLRPGAAAARRMRHAALEAACARLGIVDLLFAHHAADQAETLQIRVLSGSGETGLAGMSALTESHTVRRVRPLLGCAPAALRALLQAEGVEWVEDPSNADRRAQRGRLRHLAGGRGARVLAEAALRAGERRRAAEQAIAAWLGRHAQIYPEGFAVIEPVRVPAGAVAALVQALSGAPYYISASASGALALRLQAGRFTGMTIGGVVVQPAGRLGPGWLLTREPAAIGPAVPAQPLALWDRRFRLGAAPTGLPADAQIGALGAEAAAVRQRTALPAIVLAGLPAIRLHGKLVAVPHLGYSDASVADASWLQFSPARPAACAPWFAWPPGQASFQLV